jgi:hypothetical protein
MIWRISISFLMLFQSKRQTGIYRKPFLLQMERVMDSFDDRGR